MDAAVPLLVSVIEFDVEVNIICGRSWSIPAIVKVKVVLLLSSEPSLALTTKVSLAVDPSMSVSVSL